MRINLSQFAGFCDGVKRAYDIVMDVDLSKAKRPVFVLGELVHNPEVIKKIEKKGIGKIDREAFLKSQKGKIGTLIINAHGTGPEIYEAAREKNVRIIDTTCPKVVKVQRLARVFSRRGCKIIIVGDKDHKEVRGIDGWGGGKSLIISAENDLKNINLGMDEKICVLAQTTQNEDFYEKIGGKIKEHYPLAEIQKTTCHTTHSRQGEVKKLARENDLVVVIGSKTSANSNRLWEIAKKINPLSYFIEKAGDIRTGWFKNIQNVGVTAGASTPSWVIGEVLEYLDKL